MKTEFNDRCENCGATYGLHQFETNQCPAGGFEAPVGQMQSWAATTFLKSTLTTKQEEYHQPIERLDAEEYFKKALSENAEAQIDQALANTYIADTQVVELMIGFHAQASKADNDLIKDLKSAIEMGRQIVGARDTEIQSLKQANEELVEGIKSVKHLLILSRDTEACNIFDELLSKHYKP